MTDSAFNSSRGHPRSKSISAAMSRVSPAAMAGWTGALDDSAGLASERRIERTCHVSHENPLGPDPHGLPDHPGDDMVGHAIRRLGARVSGSARNPVVSPCGLARLLSAGNLLVVVLLRGLCPGSLCQRRHA